MIHFQEWQPERPRPLPVVYKPYRRRGWDLIISALFGFTFWIYVLVLVSGVVGLSGYLAGRWSTQPTERKVVEVKKRKDRTEERFLEFLQDDRAPPPQWIKDLYPEETPADMLEALRAEGMGKENQD